jgi:hypothetical protein
MVLFYKRETRSRTKEWKHKVLPKKIISTGLTSKQLQYETIKKKNWQRHHQLSSWVVKATVQ